ncbi:MAG: type II secretion system F family protein [bacterium]
MANFKYKALDQNKKIISGIIDAASESMAADELTERKLEIISLIKTSEIGSGFGMVLGRVKPKDIVVFSRQFSVLISANVALVQSLRVLIVQTNNLKLKMAISEIADDIDGGARLSDALARRPKIFSNFYVNIVKSGETSGKLDEALNYLADELEKDYDMTSKIKGAMIYPAFVVCGMFAVGVVMMVFVVPKLTDVLTETGTKLPIATRILIYVSDFLVNYWWLVIIGAAMLFFASKMFLASQKGKRIADDMLLRLPIFGKLFQKIYLVRFARSLHTLLVGGVNISRALAISSEVVTNSVYSGLIDRTRQNVEDGESVSSVFLESDRVPKMVSNMMSIGEKTGKLDVILERIAIFYAREVDNTVSNLMTLMEPIIMVVMGIGVGLMVAAIILPMYNMASGV